MTDELKIVTCRFVVNDLLLAFAVSDWLFSFR